MKPQHIGFEGPSGSGKSTQAKLLVGRLRERGIPAVYIKHPNGTAFGKLLMDAVLQHQPSDLAQVLAFAACFCETTRKLVLPSLRRGLWVVSDRGIGSAYAHALHRLEGTISPQVFTSIMAEIGEDHSVVPDRTFFLDVPPFKGLARKEGSPDKSAMDVADAAGLREALSYELLSREFPNPWIRIDATQEITTVAENIWRIVEKRILR